MIRRASILVASFVLAGPLACSATQGAPSGGSQGGSAAASGGAGGSAVGGGFAVGTGGTTIEVDGGSSVGGGLEDGGCFSVSQEAAAQVQPADIIFVIDNSGSMVEEAGFVQAKMNAFSQQIVASGVDIHVIMIVAYPSFIFPAGICIDPPLGAVGGCPAAMIGSDNNLPKFFHDPGGFAGVQSNDGLNVFLAEYPVYEPLLRANASHWAVIITDDDATDPPYGNLSPAAGAAQFIADFSAKPKLANFKMSGIYCHTNCPAAAAVGSVWKEVISQTGGVDGDLCTQDFQPIFDALAAQIITGAQPLDCQWGIPPAPAGQTFDPGKVNLEFTDANMMKTTIYHVNSQAECDAVLGGWYYDDNVNPTSVIACPTSCGLIQGSAGGKVDVLFGCSTQTVPK